LIVRHNTDKSKVYVKVTGDYRCLGDVRKGDSSSAHDANCTAHFAKVQLIKKLMYIYMYMRKYVLLYKLLYIP